MIRFAIQTFAVACGVCCALGMAFGIGIAGALLTLACS
jgi:hypothetical protein